MFSISAAVELRNVYTTQRSQGMASWTQRCNFWRKAKHKIHATILQARHYSGIELNIILIWFYESPTIGRKSIYKGTGSANTNLASLIIFIWTCCVHLYKVKFPKIKLLFLAFLGQIVIDSVARLTVFKCQQNWKHCCNGHFHCCCCDLTFYLTFDLSILYFISRKLAQFWFILNYSTPLV